MQLLIIGAALAVASVNAGAAAASSYTIVDLGIYTQPYAVNGAGTIVGFSDAMYNLPVVYSNGSWSVLPNKTRVSRALAINAKGVIVGYDERAQVQWKDGQRLQMKGMQPGQPHGIASDGTIVGYEIEGAVNLCYRWKSGVKTRLDGLGGSGNCYANAIDSTASYIGGQASTPSGDNHAFLATAGGTRDLGTLNGPGASSVAAVNKRGHAAAWSTFDGTSTQGAAYWNGTRLVDIGLHLAGVPSLATAINAHDDVLVVGSDGQGHVAFLYAGRTGSATALEPLVTNLDGWTFDYDQTRMLTAIGDDGVIYGETNYQGAPHAFKLVPTP